MKIKNEKRVFIGIPIGHKIKSILPSIKSVFTCDPPLIKWIPSENIHLTLSFLGNVSNNDIPYLVQSVKKNIECNNLHLTITGTGVFPSSNLPKVLWLGIGKGIDKLTSLQSQVEKSVKIIIKNSQKTTFIPHITIARIRRLYTKIDVLPFLNTVYSPIELDVNSICLYESKLFPEGAQYTVLNGFPIN